MKKNRLAVLCVLLVSSWGPVPASARIDLDQGVDVSGLVRSMKEGRSSSVPAFAAEAIPKPVAEWTIMYYINAKNSLAGYVDPDMRRMEEVGSSDKVKIIVEMGKPGVSVKRFEMQRSASTDTVTSPVVQDLGAADMGDWRQLAEYGKWVKANYPAKHYMLSIWNHGSGWLQSEGRRDAHTEGISYDDDTGHHISTTDLGKALAAMGGVDIYASDACLMQMSEVGYQLRDSAGLVIGSQQTEPGHGWNYADYMGPLSRQPTMGPQQLAHIYTSAFQSSYAALGDNTTQSVVDPHLFRRLVPLLSAWAAAVMQADEEQVVADARRNVQSYDEADNVDLVDLVERIGAGSRSRQVRDTGEALVRFVRDRLVLSNVTTGRGLENSNGLAVYLPKGPVSRDYAQLAWARESDWPRFAAWVSGLFAPDVARRS